MIRLTTQSKLKIARIASRSVISLRNCFGQSKQGVFKRNGLNWWLDLDEGIDLSIYLFGVFEREVYKCYSDILKPGMQVLDIGANIGAHTLPMARLVGDRGKVHSFEPTTFAVEKLRKNLKLNPELEARVFLNHLFLSGKSNTALPENGVPSSWILKHSEEERHAQHGGVFKSLGGANAMTLDQYVQDQAIERIDLIKIDVDGNEWSVLQGGAETITVKKPLILMEFALDYGKHSFQDMLAQFRSLNYSANRLDDGRELPLDLGALRPLIPQNGSINVCLRPPA